MFVKREILYLSFENKGYVSSVRVCVCMYEALISMTITHASTENVRVSGQKRLETTTLREKSARDANKSAVTRGHVVCFLFFYTNFLKKENFKP
jgi:hypothetical protein